jgi:hypothetical protein
MNIVFIVIFQLVSARTNRFPNYMNYHHSVKSVVEQEIMSPDPRVPRSPSLYVDTLNVVKLGLTSWPLEPKTEMLNVLELHNIMKDVRASFPAHLQMFMLKMRLFKLGKGLQVIPGIFLSDKELTKNIPTIFKSFV